MKAFLMAKNVSEQKVLHLCGFHNLAGVVLILGAPKNVMSKTAQRVVGGGQRQTVSG